MPRIQQLPHSVITKIAAGEVIERPASVVKELLENSIDAGATRLDVDIEQGGADLIRVVDDGCGIHPDDLPLAFATHATSKLRDADDLFRVGTMGFRGEALASVGGVARVCLQSRPRDHDAGAEVHCEGGDLAPVRAWNGSPGTRIEVKHLFYNVPVRRKFLKSTATEVGHVCETFTRLALSRPGLQLTLRHNGKLVYEVPATAKLLDRVGLFFGNEVAGSLYPVEAQHNDVRLSGYVADPQVERGNAKLQYLFLNGRWIRDRSLGHALQEAYRGLLMTGRYAVAFLYLDLPPDMVDVNVHPTKAEVRFRDASFLYSMVLGAVRRRLSAENLTARLQVTSSLETPRAAEAAASGPDPWLRPTDDAASQPLPFGRAMTRGAAENPPTPNPFGVGGKFGPPNALPGSSRDTTPLTPNPSPRVLGEGGTGVAPSHWDAGAGNGNQSAPLSPWGRGAGDEGASLPPHSSPKSPTLPLPNDPAALEAAFRASAAAPVPPPPIPPTNGANGHGDFKAIQLYNAYLVLETPEGMLVIDQHALHERILFEQLKRRVREGTLETQRLLIPEPVELTPEQAGLALEHAKSLADLGLEVEDFGGSTLMLHSYPAILGHRSPAKTLKAVVDHLCAKDRVPTREHLLNDILSLMACHSAVRAGDPLSVEQIAALVAQRKLADDTHHCPHGRPTALLFSKQDLDRQFGRV